MHARYFVKDAYFSFPKINWYLLVSSNAFLSYLLFGGELSKNTEFREYMQQKKIGKKKKGIDSHISFSY